MMTRRGLLMGSCLAAGACGQVEDAPSGAAITDFRLYSAQVGPRSWVAVQLRTASGLAGIGDASANESVPEGAAAAVARIFESIRGRTPFEVERLRGAALAAVAEAGRRERRYTVAACSGVEQAMWDLQGKVLELPCHALFGGKLHGTIRNYANINRATRGEDRTPDGFAANARRGVEAGFDAFKLAPFDHISRNGADGARLEAQVRQGIEFVEAVRAAIGPERDLLIDGHGRFSAEQAIDVGRRLEHVGLYWMEEMCRGLDALARFNAATEVMTAGGESLWSVNEFFPYIKSGAVDTVMPDVKYCGGMYELKKIAAMAEGAGQRSAPHGPASPLGNMAAAHVCATMPNFDILEFAYGEVPWRADCVVPAEDARGGYLTVPDRPGIGYELNPDYWQRYEG